MTSFEATLPLHVRDKFNYNSTAAGMHYDFKPINLIDDCGPDQQLTTLAGLCFAIMVFGDFFSTYIGKICDRVGSKYMVFGGILTAAITISLTAIPQENNIGMQILLWTLLLLIGFSHAMIFVPALTELSVTVEQIEKDQPGIFGPYGAFAQGYGLSNFAYAAGTTVGPIWCKSFANLLVLLVMRYADSNDHNESAGFMRHRFGWNWLVFAISVFSVASAIPVVGHVWS